MLVQLVIQLGNSAADLAKVDVDALRGYVIKLHGDFTGGSSIVLTETQYDAVNFDPKFHYLVKFIQSYFMNRHIIIVGYSVSDPDIQAILKQNKFLLRRTTPIYALIANATRPQIDEWHNKYNIQIISYPVSGTNHSALAEMLTTLVSYVGDGPLAKRQRLDVDLKVAQSLYLWHKFQVQPRSDLHLDASMALVLSIAVQAMSASWVVSCEKLKAGLKVMVGLSELDLETSLADSLQELCKEGRLTAAKSGQHFEVSKRTVELVSQFREQYSVLLDAFKRQTRIDFHAKNPKLVEAELAVIADLLVETTTSMFSDRGVEIVNMIFAGQQPRLVGAAALFRMIFSGRVAYHQAKCNTPSCSMRQNSSPTPAQIKSGTWSTSQKLSSAFMPWRWTQTAGDFRMSF